MRPGTCTKAPGFGLVQQHKGSQWGTEVNEQQFVCRLPVL